MSSRSLVLWRPPPLYFPLTQQSSSYALDAGVATLLWDNRRLPRLPPAISDHRQSPDPQEDEVDAAQNEAPPLPEPTVGESVDVGVEPQASDSRRPTARDEGKAPSKSHEDRHEDDINSGVQPRVWHQGMRKRPIIDTVDAARVLKRPFKPPTRVELRSKKPKADSPPASSPSSSGRVSATDLDTEHTDKQSSKLVSSSPLASARSSRSPGSATSRTRGRPVTAKFKPPGPSSDSESSRSSRRRRGPDADLIASLEQRVRVLKQASACKNDDRIIALIQQWRAAGREITERLFRMIPEPDHQPELLKRSKGWGWGWDEAPFSEPLSPECHLYIRDECGVRNGEIVDPDGTPLCQDEVMLDDVLDGNAGWDGGTSLTMTTYGSSVRAAPDSQPWNRGTMLEKLGVDPTLLGFNVEEDDWDDINDD